MRATDSPRWCVTCDAWGDHHTDRHPFLSVSDIDRMLVVTESPELSDGLLDLRNGERVATAEEVPQDPLADSIERHNSLGGRCTCGASPPSWRLDRPRWFAEHLADIVRGYAP